MLICACNEAESREHCLTVCPKGIQLRPDLCACIDNWPKQVEVLNEIGKSPGSVGSKPEDS